MIQKIFRFGIASCGSLLMHCIKQRNRYSTVNGLVEIITNLKNTTMHVYESLQYKMWRVSAL